VGPLAGGHVSLLLHPGQQGKLQHSGYVVLFLFFSSSKSFAIFLRLETKILKLLSHTPADNLDKTKVTGIKQVDTLQGGVNDLVANQVGQDGLGRPVGDLLSKEGLTRAERRGKQENGGYLPEAGGPVSQVGDSVISGVASGADAAGEGMKKAGGLFGFGKGE